MILAGIDIGTNATRLLIAEISRNSLRILHAARTITRLGQAIDRSGMLSREAQDRTLRALAEFSAEIKRYPVERAHVVGTSALRKAANAAAFVGEVRERTGFVLTIISGSDEARLTLEGVRQALSTGMDTGIDLLASALVVDIGGGSTELMVTKGGEVVSDASLDLGAVYATERFLRHDPPLPGELAELRRSVGQELDIWEQEQLAPCDLRARDPHVLAGTAGTVTTLAAMAQKLVHYTMDRINGYRLARDTLDGIVGELSRTPIAGRRNMPGLEQGREDIILAGAVIAQEIMARSRCFELIVSDWGLREGLVLDLSRS